MNNLIDISIPIKPGMPLWPGDPQVEIEKLYDVAKGDEATVSRISMGVHTGTHVDAPLHYFADGKSIGEIPPDALVGPARVIEVHGGANKEVQKEELERLGIKQGERILLKSANSALWKIQIAPKEFNKEFYMHLGPEAARFLAQMKIRAVGTDYLSIGGCAGGSGAQVHRILLEAGIWIIEGLALSQAAPGNYELICLPLKLLGLEAAPARAYLRPLSLAQNK
ncbi:MAG: cyclase family protein [Actinomycetota bacterium]|nr:cyclase family protein [Actinomycetota bacterium]